MIKYFQLLWSILFLFVILNEVKNSYPLRVISLDGSVDQNVPAVSFVGKYILPVSYKEEFKSAKYTTSGLDVNLSHIAIGLYETVQDRITTIIPGTLWCGSGSTVRIQSDLGLFFLSDNCCKQHDHCPKSILAGETKYGLTNTGLFTRSHCSCDQTFLNCLKRADTFISNKIGYTYFNLLSPQCFREEYPIIGCMKRNNALCMSYIIDESNNKTWQWFDNKIY